MAEDDQDVADDVDEDEGQDEDDGANFVPEIEKVD
jgi:hypothetical protein